MPPADSPRKCRGNCGRLLTDPESIERGFGRVCAERLGIPTGTPPKPARASPPSATIPPMPGQDELPLDDQPGGGPVGAVTAHLPA